MRTFTLFIFALLLSAKASVAQSLATFDTLPLPAADTYYVNYNNFGNDVGFTDGMAHFPCVYDSSWGMKFWSSGFVYSNKTDSVTPGFTNQYSAITAKGVDSSDQYIMAYGVNNKIYLNGKAKGKPVYGFYVANSTYAYTSMRDGDGFSKKFGGADSTDPDWFKLTVRGYSKGQLKSDSIGVYMADFRHPDHGKDTIYRGWRWVGLLPLGNVDSLELTLTSSDNHPQFGMNTPAYIAIDNFTTYETSSVNDVPQAFVAKVYPNPAVNELFVELNDSKVSDVYISDVMGKVVARHSIKDRLTSLPVSNLAAGVYTLTIAGEGQTGSVRFVKQ